MKMTESFKILAEFVKDISSETSDIQTYIFVKENILKYYPLQTNKFEHLVSHWTCLL